MLLLLLLMRPRAAAGKALSHQLSRRCAVKHNQTPSSRGQTDGRALS